MINNRQNGRRRGRGGTRPPNGSNTNPERGNRVDNRARGNANQLHEKYKTLARDAQTQGDRVMTEYYLQFADHYFRVLSESRSRFEEQRPRSRDDQPDMDDEDGDLDMGGYDDRGDYRDDGGQDYRQPVQRQNDGRQSEGRQNEGRQQEARQNDRQQNDRQQNDGRQNDRQQNDRQQNDGRPFEARRDRNDQRPRRDQRPPEPRQQAGERPQDEPHERQIEIRPNDMPASEPLAGEQGPAEIHAPAALPEQAERPRRTRLRREAPAVEAAPERIEIDRLPPSFAAVAPPESDASAEQPADGDEGPRRRRTRRPRTDVAPAEF